MILMYYVVSLNHTHSNVGLRRVADYHTMVYANGHFQEVRKEKGSSTSHIQVITD